MQKRNHDGWATRFGLIMAMAGNAVGLGNFLRFPGKAAAFGGAFMIPYFLVLILVGIPLLWMEWTIGRFGGRYNHGSTPGMFHRMWSHPMSKYLGIFGILLPAMVGVYYIYIESWSLGYAWQTATGRYWGQSSYDSMSEVFTSYLGISGKFLSFNPQAYFFFLITFLINVVVFSRGIARGIELVARYCVPMLMVLGIVLAIRVLTLPPQEGRSISDGLAQVWHVSDWRVLLKSDVWIAAAGQIFFTLSVGLGMIHTYASYLSQENDITLNGLSASAMNEFAEVILGGTIAIPAAVLFFGVTQTQDIAAGGTFSLGFFALPVIFQQMPGGQFFGTLWFFLLFLAGLTSSMAMFTPLLLFLEDELQVYRKKAVNIMGFVIFLLMQPVILFMHHGLLDELDYWMGEFCLVLFAAIETILFSWIFGAVRGWEELHQGAELKVPRIFFYIIKYITPTFMVILLGWWVYDSLWDRLFMTGVDPASKPYLWLARIMIMAVATFLVWGVRHAWKTHHKFFDADEIEGESI
ncbi:MAG: sodium-dependent transporter [Candidatus Hydrogenedens sp.]|jgi:SNF family Na+-dependent transporter|nr:sodium-dependent transporter [Candidatus Hydrogenedens sp.]